MTALMTGDIGDHERLSLYAGECRELGVRLLPPDINRSEIGFTIVDGAILYGLAAIKHVGEYPAMQLIQTRATGGDFASFFDLCDRINRRAVTKRVLDALIKSGALDAFCDHRAQLSAIVDDATPTKPTRSQRNVTHQTLLQLLPEEPKARVLPKVPAWSPPIQLAHEREALGCYVSHHPVRVHDHELKRLQVVPLTQLTDLPDGKEVRIAGLITRIKRILTTKTAATDGLCPPRRSGSHHGSHCLSKSLSTRIRVA
jgi:DNA polymerase-3 subunit alpha